MPKAPAKKTAAKKAPASKAAVKKTAAHKTAPKTGAKASTKTKTSAKAKTSATTAQKPAAKPVAKKAATKSAGKRPAATPQADGATANGKAPSAARAKKAAAKKGTTGGGGVKKSTVTKSTPKKAPTAKKAPAKSTAAKSTATKKTATAKRATGRGPRLAVRSGEKPWTTKELTHVRTELESEHGRLSAEISEAEEEIAGLFRDGGDGAGHDQADVGSSTFERDHEMSLANHSRELLNQVDHALRRIDDGSYGNCESCDNPIGKLRLMAFPRATLCVSCKQRQERR